MCAALFLVILHVCSTARMSFAPLLQLASLRTDPSQTKPEEPKSKLRWLVPSPPLIKIVLVFVIPALLSTLAIQVYLESDTKASHPYFFRLGILLQVLPGSSRLMRRGCNANYFWKPRYWIVLSFALLIELLLEQLLQNKKKCAIPFTVAKVHLNECDF